MGGMRSRRVGAALVALTVAAPAATVARVRSVEDDLIAAGGINVLQYADGEQVVVTAELAPDEA